MKDQDCFFPFNDEPFKKYSGIKQLEAAQIMLNTGEYFDAKKLAELINVHLDDANSFLWNIHRYQRYETIRDLTHKSLKIKVTALNKRKFHNPKPKGEKVKQKVSAKSPVSVFDRAFVLMTNRSNGDTSCAA